MPEPDINYPVSIFHIFFCGLSGFSVTSMAIPWIESSRGKFAIGINSVISIFQGILWDLVVKK